MSKKMKAPAIPENVKKLLAKSQGIKLDLACGAQKQPGWVGIDILPLPGVDIVHDIETYPWPLPDESVLLVKASHIAEHINPAKFGFVNWMNEIWRVMKPDGQLMMSLPYAGSPGYWQDPTHCNPCNEVTWAYFDPLHPSRLYHFYHPKPWKVQDCYWSVNGTMEVLLIKRREDKSYEAI